MNPVKSQTNAKNPVWDESRKGWLGCAWFEKTGPASLSKLQSGFGQDGGMQAFAAKREQWLATGLQPNLTDEFMEWRAKIEPDALVARLAQDGIDFVLPWDAGYPAALRQSSSPPAALFWRGAHVPAKICVAVVGTRKMSAYGQRATRDIVAQLAARDACIVSGLALGIDAAAHEAALDADAPTVAVLAGGLDTNSLYPRTNAPLAERILLSGGALISEFPPGTACLKHHFPQRNRLIASLAKAVVVVEAGQDSGSVLTAKLALDEGREVFAVPGPITSQTSLGSNLLIKNGAHVCLTGDDVIHEAAAASDAGGEYERQLSKDERKILDLCRTPTHADDLARFLNSPSAAVSSACMQLELMGALQDAGGHVYEMTAKGQRLLKARKEETKEA